MGVNGQFHSLLLGEVPKFTYQTGWRLDMIVERYTLSLPGIILPAASHYTGNATQAHIP